MDGGEVFAGLEHAGWEGGVEISYKKGVFVCGWFVFLFGTEVMMIRFLNMFLCGWFVYCLSLRRWKHFLQGSFLSLSCLWGGGGG